MALAVGVNLSVSICVLFDCMLSPPTLLGLTWVEFFGKCWNGSGDSMV